MRVDCGMRLLYLFVGCFLLAIGCNKNDNDLDLDKASADINILVVGNSLTNEAFSYFPFIIKDVLPDVSIKVYALYKSGCRTSEHYSNILSGEKVYKLNRFNWKDMSWSTTPSFSANEILEGGKWDVIVTNSFSRSASYYETLQPHLDNLIGSFRELTSQDTPIFWLQSPSLANCYEDQDGNYTSNEYFEIEKEVVKRIESETEISGVIPCGTAIQNARNTSLNDLGECGELTYDRLHLQEGIPKLLDAYVVAQFFLNIFFVEKSILSSTLFPDEAFLQRGVSLGKRGSPSGVTKENVELCKTIAIDAVEHPYELRY